MCVSKLNCSQTPIPQKSSCHTTIWQRWFLCLRVESAHPHGNVIGDSGLLTALKGGSLYLSDTSCSTWLWFYFQIHRGHSLLRAKESISIFHFRIGINVPKHCIFIYYLHSCVMLIGVFALSVQLNNLSGVRHTPPPSLPPEFWGDSLAIARVIPLLFFQATIFFASFMFRLLWKMGSDRRWQFYKATSDGGVNAAECHGLENLYDR